MIAPHRRPRRKNSTSVKERKLHHRTSHELVLVGNPAMRAALMQNAPQPKYNLVLSSDIPRHQLHTKAIRLLKATRGVDPKDIEKLKLRSELLNAGSGPLLYEVLLLVGLD